MIHHYNQVGCRIQSGIFINSVLTENIKETQKTNRFFDPSGFDEKFSCMGTLYVQHKLEDNIINEHGFVGKFCAKRKFNFSWEFWMTRFWDIVINKSEKVSARYALCTFKTSEFTENVRAIGNKVTCKYYMLPFTDKCFP